MTIQALIGQKVEQTQGFLEDGTRVPLSVVRMDSNIVVQVKTSEKEGYNALQLGFGIQKHGNKAVLGHTKKAGMIRSPRFLREVSVGNTEEFPIGTKIAAGDVFEAGDIVDVVGTSKGKGYAGVVKKHHFKGGPRTHGQSDRERAPGSIGQTTTPGRVYRGKRMSGHMGAARATVKNLVVIAVVGDTVYVKGLIPGSISSLVMVRKQGKQKNFSPLFKKKTEDAGKAEKIVEEEAVLETSGAKETQKVDSAEEANVVQVPEDKIEEVKKEEVADAK